MPLTQYIIDMRSLSVSERDKLIETLDRCSETGLSLSGEYFVFSFYLDSRVNPETIPGLPVELLRRVP